MWEEYGGGKDKMGKLLGMKILFAGWSKDDVKLEVGKAMEV